MSTLKNVHWNEKFSMAVCVPGKFIEQIKKMLIKAKFTITLSQDQDGNYWLGITVTCQTASEIIKDITE